MGFNRISPKGRREEKVIQSFVYGECVFPKKGNVSGLLVLQKDGTLDTFSQQKPFKAIAEIFRRRGLVEPDAMQNKKTFQKITIITIITEIIIITILTEITIITIITKIANFFIKKKE